MPVDTLHTQYNSHCCIWQKCRDVANGQEAMQDKTRREEYLPKLKNEAEDDYLKRLKRTTLFNATWRTIMGLTGMLMRKDPEVKLSAIAEPMLKDVTQTGLTIKDLTKIVATESLTVGRVGLLVDYPQARPDQEYTVAQAEQAGLRPKMALYLVESIINWSCAWINNEYRLCRVVLAEEYCCDDPEDEFNTLASPRWRVLDLFPEGGYDQDYQPVGQFVMRVRVYEKAGDKKSDVQVGVDVFPLMNGAKIPYLTFVFISSDTLRADVELPPLIDLVNMNISHYQSTADVEHGAHKTALPQPWATGMDATNVTMYMGGGDLWVNDNADGKYGMLEYSGTGLEAIEKRLARKEAQMAVLGARMLEDQKKAAETVEVAAMHRSGEQSALTTQGDTIDAGMTKALGWFDQWAGGTGEVEFKTNKDYLPSKLTAQEITALMAAWQAGGLSDQELFDALQDGGVIAETQTFEEHAAQLETSGPPQPAPVPAPAPTPAPAPSAA